ncbi:hypothetical protein ACIGXM_13920 [Kitasatospora sp. NPDC052896]
MDGVARVRVGVDLPFPADLVALDLRIRVAHPPAVPEGEPCGEARPRVV